jgi:ABC-2 type transport system permease protein
MLKKDARVYSRNKIYLFLTLLGLIIFIAIFWLVPDSVDEDIPFAISPSLSVIAGEGREILEAHGVPSQALAELDHLEELFRDEGLVLVEFDDVQKLEKAVRGDIHIYKADSGEIVIHDPGGEIIKPAEASRINVQVGIAFPPNFISDTVLNNKPKVTLYADAAVPEELRGAMEGFIRELTFQLAGYELPVEFMEDEAMIIGVDRLGDQISMQARMRPLIAFFMLMMETFALASLISNEILQRTVTALLVTPLRIRQFLMSKTIFGTALAMSQAVVVLIFVRAFTADNWSLLLFTVFLGSLLFTAVAMLVGSAGKDFIGQLMLSLLFLIPLLIPAFAVLFPGSVASWVKVLPTYPIVSLLYDVTIHHAGWNDSMNSLAYAFLAVLVIYLASLLVLKRKVATL